MDSLTTYSLYLYLVSSAEAVLSKEFLAAVIGAVIAGGFSYLSIYRSHKFALQKAAAEERIAAMNMLKLLGVEMNTAWDLYETEYASDLLKLEAGSPYIKVFPIGQNIFPLYDSAPASLAYLPPEIAAAVIRIYMRMKGIVSVIEINNADAIAAQKFASDQIQIIANSVHDKEGVSEKKLNETYLKFVDNEAVKLDMGGTADTLKILTKEAEDLISSINCSIISYTNLKRKSRRQRFILMLSTQSYRFERLCKKIGLTRSSDK